MRDDLQQIVNQVSDAIGNRPFVLLMPAHDNFKTTVVLMARITPDDAHAHLLDAAEKFKPNSVMETGTISDKENP